MNTETADRSRLDAAAPIIAKQLASLNEVGPLDFAAPSPVVGSGGVVGLRAESAEAHWLMLHAEARACDELAERNQADYDRGWNHGMAQAYRIRANWLQDICRQAGYEIPRQPEPNK